MASKEPFYDEVMERVFDEREAQRPHRTNEILFKEARSSFIKFLWAAVLRGFAEKKAEKASKF